MAKAPSVSIIYVNYNSSDLLIASVNSILEHSKFEDFEILIVDNASQADEVVKIRHWGAGRDNIQILLSNENLGFGKANNLAAKQAQGRYLFFLNPDTLLLNDAVSIFFHFLESSKKEVVACGGNLLKPDLSANDSYGNYPGLLLELCNIGLGVRFLFNDHFKKNIAIAAEVHTDKIFQVPYIVGADIFIRAERFWEMQGFDEKFFMYYEETDLFYRLSEKGYSAYILPEARIIHLEGASIGESRKSFNKTKFEILLNSKLHYFRKWYPVYSIPLLKAIFGIQVLVQFVKGNLGSDFKAVMGTYLKAIS